jgi:cytochrome P450
MTVTTGGTPAGVVYDPSTRRFQDEIWDVYRTLRDEHPVLHDATRDQFVLTRFEDVWRAVNDWESFSSVVDEAQNLLPQMIYMDPPRHTALRALVSVRRRVSSSTASSDGTSSRRSTSTRPWCRASSSRA